jgi:hypothetical protein
MTARTIRKLVQAAPPCLAFECALVAAVASALNLPLPGLEYDYEPDYDYEQGRADYQAWRRARQGDAS